MAPFARSTRYEAASNVPRPATYVGGGLDALPRKVVEQCFALADTADRVEVIELKERAQLLVVEWVATQGPMIEDFEQMRQGFIDQMQRYRAQNVIAEWFKPDNIRARNGFALATN